jgi:hypothetical protein
MEPYLAPRGGSALAKADPGNMEWQRDLAVSYGNVGGVQEAQGDLKAVAAQARLRYPCAAKTRR